MWMKMLLQIQILLSYVEQIRDFAATENAEVVVISARAGGRNF